MGGAAGEPGSGYRRMPTPERGSKRRCTVGFGVAGYAGVEGRVTRGRRGAPRTPAGIEAMRHIEPGRVRPTGSITLKRGVAASPRHPPDAPIPHGPRCHVVAHCRIEHRHVKMHRGSLVDVPHPSPFAETHHSATAATAIVHRVCKPLVDNRVSCAVATCAKLWTTLGGSRWRRDGSGAGYANRRLP